MTEREFFKKYPDADPNRFVFKDDKVFFKINPDNEYRLADIEYRVFYDSPEWTKYISRATKTAGLEYGLRTEPYKCMKKTHLKKTSIISLYT